MGGRSSSKSSSSQFIDDSRVAASDDAIAIGEDATVSFSSNYAELDGGAIGSAFDFANDVLGAITDIAGGAASTISKNSDATVSAIAAATRPPDTQNSNSILQTIMVIAAIGAAVFLLPKLVK